MVLNEKRKDSDKILGRKFYTEEGEAQAKVSQRGVGCSFSGNIQDQAGESSELPDLGEGAPAPCQVLGLDGLEMSLPTQIMP